MSSKESPSDTEIESLQTENEELKEALEKTRSEKHTGRRILVASLIVLGSIIFGVANVANWAHDTVLDTDTWVATVGPLSQNPVIVSTLSDAIVEGVSEQLELSPPETPGILTTLGILEKPLVELVEDLLSETISTVLLSDEFNEVWVTANEVIHGALITVLSGDNPYIYAEDGIVYLDLNELVNEVFGLLGLKELSIFETGDDIARFELMESDTLAVIQRALRFLNRIAILSIIIVVLCFGGAIAVSKWRRSTVITIGIGTAITMLISLILFNIGEAIALGSILDPSLYDFASELLNAFTNGLVTQTALFMILGLVIAAVARFTRPKSIEVEK